MSDWHDTPGRSGPHRAAWPPPAGAMAPASDHETAHLPVPRPCWWPHGAVRAWYRAEHGRTVPARRAVALHCPRPAPRTARAGFPAPRARPTPSGGNATRDTRLDAPPSPPGPDCVQGIGLSSLHPSSLTPIQALGMNCWGQVSHYYIPAHCTLVFECET